MIDYTVFNLSADASGAEVEKAYTVMKRKYRARMLAEGEEGAEAARALERLDAEYKKYQEGAPQTPAAAVRRPGTEYRGSSRDYTHIEGLIKAGKADEAQQKLDAMTDRDAEWYFVQALVYYKKSWFAECKKQLEMAMKLDPANKKYKDNYLSLLAYAEIMQQKAVADEEARLQAEAKGRDCCSGNNGSCTAPCISDCCFKDEN